MQPKQINPNYLQRAVEKENSNIHQNYRWWWLKNGYLATFLLSAFCGVIAISALRFVFKPYRPEALDEFLTGYRSFFLPVLIPFIIIIIIIIYERPIRRFINLKFLKQSVPENLEVTALRRVLMEPFFIVSLNLIGGLGAACAIIIVHYRLGLANPITRVGAFDALLMATIIATFSFFTLEYFLNRWLSPFFFPGGRLHHVPGSWQINLRIRLIALFFAINLIPLAGALLTVYRHSDYLELLLVNLITTVPLYILVGIGLTLLISGNLTRSLKNLAAVLRGVSRGKFETLVRVSSNDEIGYVGDIVNEMIFGLREREFIKDTFGRYVAREVRDEVLSGNIPLDGEVKEVTVLFADLRDFTPLTESNDPKLVVKIMNNYFKEMAEAVQDNEGLVLQFLGDEIYAVFGAPVFRPEHAIQAFKAGISMNHRLAELNKQFAKRNWPKLSHGIGIHTGQALAANIGSPDRMSYLLVGDTINLASRLQSITKEIGTEMIISKATHSSLSEADLNEVELKCMPPIEIKGKKHRVEIYAVV